MKNRRTKIIATLGPSCSDISIIQDLANKGVNCFRVNLSHGTMEQKINFFKLIKTIKTEEQNRPAILADLAGPKIRVFGLDKPIILNNGCHIGLCFSISQIGDLTWRHPFPHPMWGSNPRPHA